MKNGQKFQIKCLGQKFVVTVDDENFAETEEFGLWTEQEIKTLDGCDWSYSPERGLLFQGASPRFPIEEFKRIR